MSNVSSSSSRGTRLRSLRATTSILLLGAAGALGALGACSSNAEHVDATIDQDLRRGAPRLLITSDATNVTFSITYPGTPAFVQVLIDTDRNASTSYPVGGIGAEFLVENGVLYRYTGADGSWAWSAIKTVGAPGSNGTAVFVVARADIDSPTALDAVAATSTPERISKIVTKDLSATGATSDGAAGSPSGPGGGSGGAGAPSTGGVTGAGGSTGGSGSAGAPSTDGMTGAGGSTAGDAAGAPSDSGGSSGSARAPSTGDTTGAGGSTSGGTAGSASAGSGSASSVSFPMPLRPASSFGIACDGTTDDTAALNSALAALQSGGGTLVLDAGKTCLISASVRIDGGAGFAINGQGSTIKAVDGTPNDGPLLMFMSSRSYVVANLRVDGNRQHRTPVEAWSAHNVMVQSGSDYSFVNVASDNADCDGFLIESTNRADPSTYPTHGLFQDCRADFGFRQGMSVINATDLRIIGGSYTNTAGTAPEAGIDLEPDAGTAAPGIDQVLIRGVTFSGNHGNGLEAYWERVIQHVTVENSLFDNNGLGAATLGFTAAVSNSLIQNNTFQHQVSIALLLAGPNTTGNVVRNNKIIDNPSGAGILVDAGVGPNNFVIDNVFINNGGPTVRAGSACAAGNTVDGGSPDQPAGSCGAVPAAGYSL